MKLTYWYCRNKIDTNAYSIRAKTRREAIDQIACDEDAFDYDALVEISVEYDSCLDLVRQCLGEGGIDGEYAN